MYVKKTINYIIFIALATVLLIQCKDEEEKTQAPQITNIELSAENSKTVNLGELLQIKATIFAEGSIDKINIEIKPKTTALWVFDTTYTEFSGLQNLALNQSLSIPLSADSGLYTFSIQVTDLAGNQTTHEDQIQILFVESTLIVPFSVVNGFIIDNEGRKLLATDKGVFMLDVSAQAYVQLESNVELIPANDLAQNTNGSSVDLWIASNLGAFNYNLNELLSTTNSPLINNAVNRISIDQNNIIYYATPEGISIKNDSEWLTNLGIEGLYSEYQITDLATASNGYTYVATQGGGVERFNVDVDGISGATVFDTDWSKLRSNNVLTVFVDDTVQAFGTDMGVAIHSSEYTKWDWENYTTTDGLISDTVLSIVKDISNNWWFGTVKGLSKLDGENWTSYTAEIDGFKSNTIKFMAVDADGSLWIASDKGLSHFKNNIWTNY
jgi:ligand-binding sensor domain-containing protein